jgi:Lipase (class 3)
MISDLDCARACADTYNLPPTLPVPQTGVDCRINVIDNDGEGAVIVAFRGSVTAEDWARDFICAPIADRAHPQLGSCHAGFLDGAESIVDAVLQQLGYSSAAWPRIITGHSLGGALALGVGALLTVAGKPPSAIVTFGAPRFGMDKFVAAIASVTVRQYRRGNDPVPLVPFDVPPLLNFLDARDPLIAIGAAQRDPFACHAIGGYVADVGSQKGGSRKSESG